MPGGRGPLRQPFGPCWSFKNTNGSHGLSVRGGVVCCTWHAPPPLRRYIPCSASLCLQPPPPQHPPEPAGPSPSRPSPHPIPRCRRCRRDPSGVCAWGGGSQGERDAHNRVTHRLEPSGGDVVGPLRAPGRGRLRVPPLGDIHRRARARPPRPRGECRALPWYRAKPLFARFRMFRVL